MSDTPTCDYVAKRIEKGTWLAQPGESVDLMSLSDREFRIFEMCLWEKVYVELKKGNAPKKPVKK